MPKSKLSGFDNLAGTASVFETFIPGSTAPDSAGSAAPEILLSQIEDFPNHPFLVTDNEEMERLVASIAANGLLQPILVRNITSPNAAPGEERYQLIAGHRRKRACEKLGIDKIPAQVLDVTFEAATVIMADTNFAAREKILPSEKAKAYKMLYEAKGGSRQGQRTDLTSVALQQKLKGITTRQKIAEDATYGDGEYKTRQYLRLNYLNPELLQMVDNAYLGLGKRPPLDGKNAIQLRAAVELSYLDAAAQKLVAAELLVAKGNPNFAQTKLLREEFSKTGELTARLVTAILNSEKGNEKASYRVPESAVAPYIPKKFADKGMTAQQFIIDAVKFYHEHNFKEQQAEFTP
jgi:ParB family chromosome partitioning protein